MVLVSGLAWVAPSLAQSDITALQRPSRPMCEAAQTHGLSGTRFFEFGQFDAALGELEAAYRLSAGPDLLHNLNWTHETAGHIREAVEYAARYQAAVQGEAQERARRHVEFLKQRYPTGTASEPASPSSTVVSSDRAQCLWGAAEGRSSAFGAAARAGACGGRWSGGGRRGDVGAEGEKRSLSTS